MAGVVAAKMKAKKQKEEEEEAKVINDFPLTRFTHSTETPENIAVKEGRLIFLQVKNLSFIEK